MHRYLVCLVSLALLACGGEEPPGPPAALEDLSGASLTGTVGEQLLDPLRVRVTDADGRGVPGVAVDFTTDAGSGQITLTPVTTSSAALLSVAAVVDSTDENGEAEARWTLGTVAGEQRATVTVAGVPTLAIVAQAAPGAAAQLQFRDNSGFIGVAGQAANAPLAVRVADEFTNPLGGVLVTWAASGGGGVSQTTGETDGEGVSETTATLGASHGLQFFTARTPTLGPDTLAIVAVLAQGDPGGDTEGVPAGATAPDIRDFGATLFDGFFVFYLQFSGPVIPPPPGGSTAGNNTVALIEIDADGDPVTGLRQQQACIGAGPDSLGVDYYVDLDPSSPLRNLFPSDLPGNFIFVVDVDEVDPDDACLPVTGSVLATTLVVQGNVAALGVGQDFLTNSGTFDVAVLAGVPTTQGQIATDFLPDEKAVGFDVTGGVVAAPPAAVSGAVPLTVAPFVAGARVTGVDLTTFASHRLRKLETP